MSGNKKTATSAKKQKSGKSKNQSRGSRPSRVLGKGNVSYAAFMKGLSREQLLCRAAWLQERIESLRVRNCERSRKEVVRLTQIALYLTQRVLSTASSDIGEGGDFNSEETTVMMEAPFDIPVRNDQGATPIERAVRVEKAASSGTAGGGYYAQLLPSDILGYVQLSTSGFKIKQCTSYSIGSEESRVAYQTTSADELLGCSVSNYTRIGEGFSGIVTKFPMGDLPLYLANETAAILGHNVGTTTGLKVVFDLILELLI